MNGRRPMQSIFSNLKSDYGGDEPSTDHLEDYDEENDGDEFSDENINDNNDRHNVDFFNRSILNKKNKKNKKTDYDTLQKQNKDILDTLSSSSSSNNTNNTNKSSSNTTTTTTNDKPQPSYIGLVKLYERKSNEQYNNAFDDYDSSSDDSDESSDIIHSNDDSISINKNKRHRSDDDNNNNDSVDEKPIHIHKKIKNKKEETFDGKDSCFLCAYGDRFHDGIHLAHINKLNDIIDQCYGITSNKELAEQLHMYFKKNVYQEGIGMAMLEKDVALRHIEEFHSLSAKIYIGESIKKWSMIRNLLERSLFLDDCTPVTKNIIVYERVQKIISSFYTMPLPKMNFNLGATKEDLNKLGAFHHIMPEFTHKREKRIRTTNKRQNVEFTGSNVFLP